MCVCRGRTPTVPIVVRVGGTLCYCLGAIASVILDLVPLFPPRRASVSTAGAWAATWAAPQPSSSDEVGPQ